ncbi:MAG: hypothetical protein PHS97_04575 [Oscillospiraceae bacterium]|nr:hypothetical protein [Oscillospiraceae bacterium]
MLRQNGAAAPLRLVGIPLRSARFGRPLRLAEIFAAALLPEKGFAVFTAYCRRHLQLLWTSCIILFTYPCQIIDKFVNFILMERQFYCTVRMIL